MSEPKFKVGDIVVHKYDSRWSYRIIDINSKYRQYKVETLTGAVEPEIGTYYWHDFSNIDENTRPLTKLEKAMK